MNRQRTLVVVVCVCPSLRVCLLLCVCVTLLLWLLFRNSQECMYMQGVQVPSAQCCLQFLYVVPGMQEKQKFRICSRETVLGGRSIILESCNLQHSIHSSSRPFQCLPSTVYMLSILHRICSAVPCSVHDAATELVFCSSSSSSVESYASIHCEKRGKISSASSSRRRR